MWWLTLTGVVAIVSAVVVPLDLGRRDRSRWGIRREGHLVDPGPYRGGLVHQESERGAPLLVRFAAGASIAWGLITMLIFAPAGCLLLLLVDEMPVLALLMVPLVLSGFVLSFRLLGVAGELLKNEGSGVDGTAAWSAIHHVMVALVFALGGALHMPRDPWIGLVPSIPAAIGLLLAFALHRAGARAARMKPATPATPAFW